ncbi:MAG TPA: radical SAM protein [Armatimonadota bacterium]|nr:radical SAM protein [Armatimonadota bacterium]
MVIFGKWNNQTVTLSLKANSFTISLQSPGKGDSQVYSFDGCGRLWTAMLQGISYRRGLNGRTVAKWQTGAGGDGRERRWLAVQEASRLEEQARQTVAALLEELSGGMVQLENSLPAFALPMIEHAAAFDLPRYSADVMQYHQVYKPVGILPPDQYMAVVLQATEGCSFNTCTFCNFYRDRPFRIRTAEEFRSHARAVREYLGDGLSLRRTIFLGDANALVVPMPRLLPLLDIVNEVYDVERMGGIYAFLDGFSGEKKNSANYAELARRGMKRIYIGMESGSEELLRLLNKPGKPEDVIQAVKAIKAGGLAVGIIVLLGAGGHFYSRVHVRETIAAINQMPLDLDDLIYFSELIESEGLEYTRDAYDMHLQPLTTAERIAQGEEIEAGLTFSEERGVPHISRYDIREFVY